MPCLLLTILWAKHQVAIAQNVHRAAKCSGIHIVPPCDVLYRACQGLARLRKCPQPILPMVRGALAAGQDQVLCRRCSCEVCPQQVP